MTRMKRKCCFAVKYFIINLHKLNMSCSVDVLDPDPLKSVAVAKHHGMGEFSLASTQQKCFVTLRLVRRKKRVQQEMLF